MNRTRELLAYVVKHRIFWQRIMDNPENNRAFRAIAAKHFTRYCRHANHLSTVIANT